MESKLYEAEVEYLVEGIFFLFYSKGGNSRGKKKNIDKDNKEAAATWLNAAPLNSLARKLDRGRN